jgi:glycosyltransferase involved in cell wall biosynthesis
MRVLNVIPDDRMGGPQIRSLRVAETLRDRGVETVFAVPDGDGDFEKAAAEAGFSVHTLCFQRIRSPRKPVVNARFLAGYRRTVSRLTSLIATVDADVVHANVSTNFQGAHAAARSDTALVWHFNDSLTPWPIRNAAAALARRWADEIVVAADAVADYYFPGGRTQTRTVYAPIDIETFDPDTVGQTWPDGFLNRDDPPSCPVVGTVGNINPAKGHEDFIHTVDRVRSRHGPLLAPIVGKPLASRRKHFRRLQRLVEECGLENTVHFCGYRGDIPSVLSTLDVFVLSSVSEACPMVVLEAMAMERPVVATDVGGVREQISDDEHGFIVPSSEPGTMAKRIETLLTDADERRRLGKNARQRASEKFSLPTITDRLLSIYERAAA